MNKTLTINIGGFVFHIDEEAYQLLENYFNAIKNNLQSPDLKSEVMQDIEARVAELFKTLLGKGREVVSVADVQSVMNTLGSPEVFKEENASESGTSSTLNDADFTYSKQSRSRRIYRDTDDVVAGGVCSGISNYFGIDPLYLRLAWALSLFIFGFGFFLYIILWVIIPPARSTAEKLEMKGEPVNIQNIEKQVKQELDVLGNRMKDFGKEASIWGKKPSSALGGFIHDALNLFTQLFIGLLTFVGRVIGVVFLIVASVLCIVVLGALFGFFDALTIYAQGTEIGFDAREFLSHIFVSSYDVNLMLYAIGTLAAIPIILLVYVAARLLFKIKRQSFVKWFISALFVISLCLMFLPFRNLKRDTRAHYTLMDSVKLSTQHDTLFLEADIRSNELLFNDFRDEDADISIHGEWNVLPSEGSPKIVGITRFDIVKSDYNYSWFEVVRSAKGGDKATAAKHTENIQYGITPNGNKVVLNGFFELADGDKFRNQRSKIRLHLAEGHSVYLSENLKFMIYDIKNTSNTYDLDMLQKFWTMTENGLHNPFEYEKENEDSPKKNVTKIKTIKKTIVDGKEKVEVSEQDF